MTVKKSIYNVDNGTSFDEIHFRTSEDMLVGVVQNLSGIGYRKLPGGLILQWGVVDGVTYTGRTIKLPNRMESGYGIQTTTISGDYASGGRFIDANTILIKNLSSANPIKVSWKVIGC